MDRRLMEKFESNPYNFGKLRAREVGDQGHTFTPNEPMTREVGGQENILMPDDVATREMGGQDHTFMLANVGLTEVGHEDHIFNDDPNVLVDPIGMMNDEVDPVEYYMTPSPTIVSDDDHLLNEDNVLEEVTSKVDGRPFRKKKSSLFLQSPYTIPRKSFKYLRNFGLRFEPLRAIPECKIASFDEFMRKPYNKSRSSVV